MTKYLTGDFTAAFVTLASIVDGQIESSMAVLVEAKAILSGAIQDFLDRAAGRPRVTAVYLRVSGFNVQVGVVLADYDGEHVTAFSDLEEKLSEVHSDFCVTLTDVYSRGKSLEQLEQEGAMPAALDYDAQVTPPFTRIYPLNQ